CLPRQRSRKVHHRGHHQYQWWLPDVLNLLQNALAAVAIDDLFDHLDAKPWPPRRKHPPVLPLERLFDELVLHRVPQRLELEELARGAAERDRQAGRTDDRR